MNAYLAKRASFCMKLLVFVLKIVQQLILILKMMNRTRFAESDARQANTIILLRLTNVLNVKKTEESETVLTVIGNQE